MNTLGGKKFSLRWTKYSLKEENEVIKQKGKMNSLIIEGN
jgi:hypothetical protein